MDAVNQSGRPQVLSENVKVFCRQREGVSGVEVSSTSSTSVPLSDAVVGKDHSYISEILKAGTCKYYSPNLKSTQAFDFNGCFDMSSSQQEVFDATSKPLIESVIEGYSATILAYGKTGSGKTFTMRGGDSSQSKGIIPRCIESLLSSSSHHDFEIWVSYFQVYCEDVTDLLVSNQNPLAIKDNGERAYVEGLSRSRVTSVNDISMLLDRGDSVRATASTNANDTSSRSHAILTITLRKNNDSQEIIISSSSSSSTSLQPRNVTESSLVLVDLAGSERYNDISGTAYARRAESKSINLSLSSLGNCIHALSEGKSHIPFRDSKLTRLLRASLGGGSRLSIIVTVPPGPDSNGDILNSLRFAARAAKVKVEAKVSRFVDYESLYRDAQLQIDAYSNAENKVVNENKEFSSKIEAQEREIQELKMQLMTAQLSVNAFQQNDSKRETREGSGTKSNIQDNATSEELTSIINTMKGKFDNDVLDLKRRYDKKITGLTKTVSELEREVSDSQSILNLERTGQLATLRELRVMQEKLMALESDSQTRIQELVVELQEQRAANDDMTEKTTSLVDYYKNLMVTSMVPKEKVEEMERLFMETIEKLSSRVMQIENKKEKAALSPVDEQHGEDLEFDDETYSNNGSNGRGRGGIGGGGGGFATIMNASSKLGQQGQTSKGGLPLPPASNSISNQTSNQRSTRMEPGGKIRVNNNDFQYNNNNSSNISITNSGNSSSNSNFIRSLSAGQVGPFVTKK